MGNFMVLVANFIVSTYEAVAKQLADIQKYPHALQSTTSKQPEAKEDRTGKKVRKEIKT